MVEHLEDGFDDQEFDDEDFAGFDAIIECFKMLPQAKVLVMNPARAEQMRFSWAMIKKVLRETKSNAKLEFKRHEFVPSIGVIRVEGASLDFLDIEGFSRAAEFASNLEVYPLEKNRVRMAFTFHDLFVPAFESE